MNVSMNTLICLQGLLVPKAHSMPGSPSMSRSSTPAPSEDEDDDMDEPDSEEEREELSKRESPHSGSRSPVSPAMSS